MAVGGIGSRSLTHAAVVARVGSRSHSPRCAGRHAAGSILSLSCSTATSLATAWGSWHSTPAVALAMREHASKTMGLVLPTW